MLGPHSPERSWIVVDLGFGDAGKGLVTDALVRRTGARLVVRYNGGAQAGHNVVTADGRHHTFAQIGAGSFVDGVATLLGPAVVVHPTALLAEVRVLAEKGVHVGERLGIAASAPVITPFHQALNRLRELARGGKPHGSCGVGVGATVAHGLRWPDERVVAGDLGDRARLRDKAAAVRARLAEEADTLAGAADARVGEAVARERAIFARADIPAVWAERAAEAARWVVPDGEVRARVAAEREVVFEGAQGVLLDEDHGFHPHTTWSRCTDVHARALVPAPEVGGGEIVRVGVARAWAVRHGAGPLPTEDAALAGVMADHNATNPWQGPVRVGHFDAVLLRYALAVQPVDKLVVTHMDALRRGSWRACERYEVDGDVVTDLPVERAPTLEGQAALGAMLSRARPVLGPPLTGEGAVRARIAALLGRAVDGVGRGATTGDLAMV